jgi:hypothetical protein
VADTRLTLRQAAAVLGVSESAIRKRLERGTLRSDKGLDGRRYVYLDTVADNLADQVADASAPRERDALISELRAHNGTLREQLEAERQAHAEARRIIAGLVERIPSIEAPQEARESPQTVEEERERAEPRSATGEAQESTELPQQWSGWRAPVETLPWWQYLLGLLAVASTAGAISSTYLYEHVSAFLGTDIAAIVKLSLFWAVPGIFGFWVGLKRKTLSLVRHLVPVGAIAGILGTFAALPETAGGPNAAPGLAVGVFVPTLVFYVSGAIIGRAVQRRTAGAYPSLVPDAETPPSTSRLSTPGDRWSPRKQAILGFAGTVIAALLSLFAQVIGAILASGG